MTEENEQGFIEGTVESAEITGSDLPGKAGISEQPTMPNGVVEAGATDTVSAPVATEVPPKPTGLPSEIIEGLVTQIEQIISVLGNSTASELKLQRAQLKLGEALSWLKQDLKAKKPAQ